MSSIISFLSNPITALIGYILSVAAAIIAIIQFREKSKAEALIEILQIEIKSLHTRNENQVHLGEKSQYFQDNSGSITIDNRG